MEFGRTEHIEEIDFSLPPDDPLNDLLWQRSGVGKQQPVRLCVGCTTEALPTLTGS